MEFVKAFTGAPDHVEMVDSAFESASERSEDYEDAACEGRGGLFSGHARV